MAEITTKQVVDYLLTIQGQIVTLDKMRSELHIEKWVRDGNGNQVISKSFDGIRNIVHQLLERKTDKILKVLSRGEYKVIKQVVPVKVFGEPISDPINLVFPRDRNTESELDFAQDITFREGDLIVIAGVTNFGKTLLCMNFLAENLDKNPVLMGNEYTNLDGKPSARLLQNIEHMPWAPWRYDDGGETFTLLPVREDYAEHVIPDRLNIIDWINLDEGNWYMIGSVMEGIKRQLGRGIGIVAIQKSQYAEAGRGGQFTQDFADCELQINRLGETNEALLRIGKVKEPKRRVMGRTFAYTMSNGVDITNFREVDRCRACWGKGWRGTTPCKECDKTGYRDKVVAREPF